MTIEEFAVKIQRAVGTKLGEQYEVQLQRVRKNNNVYLHGILILTKKQNVSPTIYLDSFLDAYGRGVSLSEIVEKIICIYKEDTPGSNVNMEFFKEFDKVKNRICYRLIHISENGDLLKAMPHIEFMDMAIVFFYAYQGRELGDGSIAIHNTHMEMWNTTTAELLRLAQINTPNLFPWESNSMEDILVELMEDDDFEGLDESEREAFWEKAPMLVLSNKKRVYGAACILYPGLLEKLSEKTKTGFYILPSSIHEVILLQDCGDEDVKNLKNMIEEVNRTQVQPEEFLSDSLYYFQKSDKKIKRIL